MTQEFDGQENYDEDDDLISKTQLKNESKALQKFGKELINLPASKLALLPLSDETKLAIQDFHKQSGNIARKRHLAYIGKCLRHDDAEAARIVIVEDNFSQLRAQAAADKPKVSNDLLNDLLAKGDVKIQELFDSNPQLDRQALRQLVRNVNNAKTELKKQQTTEKLNQFLLSNQLN